MSSQPPSDRPAGGGREPERSPIDAADAPPGLSRREALQRAGRIAYVAPTIMIFSMSALAQQGPGSPPPPPFIDPRRGP
jgi:hypothetical protein